MNDKRKQIADDDRMARLFCFTLGFEIISLVFCVIVLIVKVYAIWPWQTQLCLYILVLLFCLLILQSLESAKDRFAVKIMRKVLAIVMVAVILGGLSVLTDSLRMRQYAHQETIKPYQYVISKDDKVYYKLSKNSQTLRAKRVKTTVKISDHTKTIVYGKKWVANKNATKHERRFVNQQSIKWYKVEYRKAANS